MDKNAIKKYAVWARRELIERVAKKAQQYGIEENTQADANANSVNGNLLTSEEKKERQALIAQISDKGYEQVMEEVAYTWFNRFSALRFMEVNGYLPTHVRVFTDEENNFKPQILAEAIHLELDGLDMEKVYDLKEANKTDELYKYLLITQCNALNAILPGMFQKIADYTELLLPDNLLREGSAIEQMIALIPEDDWKDAVQIIGWLYQYYNSEKKDEVFAALKKNVKITKENIPAATQLFTPDWIVRYMVENSLGRLWVEGHPNEELKSNWKYYLDEAQQEADVQAQFDKIREEYKELKLEDIKCIDPCCGSGHILAYMFDVLTQIYEAYGYTSREAVVSIVKNNIYGLDIDDRAAQLANFAVMMKARQYDHRFFSRKDEDGNLAILQPNVYSICESNHISKECLDYFANGDVKLSEEIYSLVDEMHDAKEYGSILNITAFDFDAMFKRFDEIEHEADISIFAIDVIKNLLPVVRVANLLAHKYDVVVTNPPYMSSSGMSSKLSEYVKNNYPDSKSDLFAVFIEHCMQMARGNGYQAMITQHAWMFLSSFEKLRSKLLKMDTVNMAHLGARAFEEIGGEVVQTTSFVLRKSHIQGCKGVYCRLIEPTTQQGKEDMFLAGENRYESVQNDFSKIPGGPIAYWVSERFIKVFNNKKISDLGDAIEGIKTGENDRFLRLWFEINGRELSLLTGYNEKIHKWCFTTKGGLFRKWYGNINYVMLWKNKGEVLRTFSKSSFYNEKYNMMEATTWTYLTSGQMSFRYLGKGFFYNNKGPAFFSENRKLILYVTGILNSIVGQTIQKFLNPTLTILPGNIRNIPVVRNEKFEILIENLVEENIFVSKSDWDSFETSWNFTHHPLVRCNSTKKAFEQWRGECDDRFNTLKANEEEINRIFIDIYGLQDELTPGVEDKDVTVRKADLKRDIKSLISYAVGCMFGRYSIEKEGLIYAGGDFTENFQFFHMTHAEMKNYTYGEIEKFSYAELEEKYFYLKNSNNHEKALYRFRVDVDNIIPICDDEYFEDDIVGRFVKFIEIVYGKDTLEENLKFISDALGGKGSPREVIRNYFLNDFFNDHCKIYQKRPIYWQFDSGKKNGFKCLIYMHRYQPDTIMRIRTDYVHEQQSRYRTAITDLEMHIADASTSERVKLNKKLSKLQGQADEVHVYEEKIHHLADQMIRIDLDDGVKHNYAIFQDVLAKIK